MDCIDLKERFGKRYRIKRDEAASPQSQDPWEWVIPCQYGEIYPWGGDYLAVMVTGVVVANRMRHEFPEFEIIQDADDAVCFTFHVKHFEKVAKRVGAKTKRQPSDQERLRLAEMSRKYSPLRKKSDTSPSVNGKIATNNERSVAKVGLETPKPEIVEN